jgi:uncharacterized protein YbjQ (UPF0145 family)
VIEKERRMIVTTTNDVTGYRVVQHLGVVRGLTVRSRSIIGNIGAGIQRCSAVTSPSTPSLPKRRARRRSI